MKAKKVLVWLFGAAMLVSAAGCGSSAASTGSDAAGGQGVQEAEGTAKEDLPLAKYPEEVTVHLGGGMNPNAKIPEGMTYEDNTFLDMLKEDLNINVVYDWVASSSDYDEKMNLCIGSNTIPELMNVNAEQYRALLKYDLIQPIGSYYEDYASDKLKSYVESGGEALQKVICNEDGEMMAIPAPNITAGCVNEMWIRQDWLDQLGLEVPKTVDELGEVAQKFKDAGLSPDYAIAGIDNGGRTYSNFLNSSNNGYGFDAVYQAFNATPGYFLKDDSGELYWGTTTDEMKEALTTLHDWYEKGLINPEVGTTTNGDNANNVKNGTCGIFMGPWWNLGYGNPDSFRNDNNANWQAYPLYTKDGEWNIHMKDVGTTYTMVNKNASDDVKKAIVIMNNVLVRDESTFDTSVAIGWYPLRNCMAATDECEYEYDALMGIIKGEASADDYQQGGSKFNGLYKNLANDAATLKDVISEDYDGSRDLTVTDMDVNTNNGQFNRFYALLIGDRPYATLEPDHKIYSELYYTIDGMDTYWTQISDLEDKSILQFITGAKSLDEWDQFCTDWHVQGGDQILELVKDYLAE